MNVVRSEEFVVSLDSPLIPSEPTGGASRPWNRWHCSTWVFLIVPITLLILLNVPGNKRGYLLVSDRGDFGPDFDISTHCLHGWPLTYLQRGYVALHAPPWMRMSMWRLWEGVDEFWASRLVVDVLLAVALIFASGYGFERWRRRRARLWQVHLGELLILTAIVSVIGAYLMMERSAYRAEQRALDDFDAGRDPTLSHPVRSNIYVEQGGPTWLIEFLDHNYFQMFDRVVEIMAIDREVPLVMQMPHMRVLDISTVSDEHLRQLAELPDLEALDLSFGKKPSEDDLPLAEWYLQLPNLPRLRGLNLFNARFKGQGLENIPNIEYLGLSGTRVDDASVPALCELTKLKQLYLQKTKITEAGVAQIREVLPKCTVYSDDTSR